VIAPPTTPDSANRLSPEFEAIDDLVIHYLDVLDAIGLDRPPHVGRVVRRVDAEETDLFGAEAGGS